MPANTLRRCRRYSRSTLVSAIPDEPAVDTASIISPLAPKSPAPTSSLIHPALHVGTGRRRLLHPLRHRRHITLMHRAAADVVRMFRVAREAVLAPLAVHDLRLRRRRRPAEKLLHLVHGVVQIAVVHRPA